MKWLLQIERLVRDRWLYLLAFTSVLALTLSYQIRTPYPIDISARINRPFISGFYVPESDNGVSFRWSQGKSQIVLPALGQGAAGTLMLRMRGYRQGDTLPQVSIFVNGQPLTSVPVRATFANYSFDIRAPAQRDATLAIVMSTSTFSTKTDSRKLGVMVQRARIDPAPEWNWVTPVWAQVAWLTLGILSVYLMLCLLGIRRGRALIGAYALLGAAALLLGWFRLWFTPSTAELVVNGWLAGALALSAFWILKRVSKRDSVSGDKNLSQVWMRWLVVVFAFGVWFAFSGLTHPDFQPVDQALRAHLIDDLIKNGARANNFYFTNPQSDAWGGGFVLPYPPTYDILVSPLHAVVPKDAQFIPLLNFLAALFYAASVFPIFVLTLQLVPGDGRAGVFAALAWIVMPISFLPLSDGAYPNIFGQLLALTFLAAFAVLYQRITEPRIFAALTVLLFFTFMVYSPLMLFVFLLLCLWLVVRRVLTRDVQEKRRLRYLFYMLVIGLGGALLLYYGRFVSVMLLETIPSMLSRFSIAGTVGQSTFMGQGWVLPSELIAHFRVLPIIAALIALVLIPAKKSAAYWIYVCALLVFVPFGIGENWVNFYNKHMLWLVPYAAIGTGIVLSMLWQRGWLARGLALATMGYLAYAGILVWLLRVFLYVLPPGSGVEKPFGG